MSTRPRRPLQTGKRRQLRNGASVRIDGAWHPADSTFTYDPASDTLTFDVYWNPEKDLALSFKLSGEDLDRFMKRVVKVRMNGRETTGEATKGTAPQAG